MFGFRDLAREDGTVALEDVYGVDAVSTSAERTSGRKRRRRSKLYSPAMLSGSPTLSPSAGQSSCAFPGRIVPPYCGDKQSDEVSASCEG